MPRIYQRDNLGSQLTPALEAALNRRRSYEQAEQQRIQSNTNAVINGLKTVYDAWDKRDMLQKQQEFQKDQLASQFAFNAEENAKNRWLQRDLQDAQLKIQKQQLADNRLVDQAKALRDVKDSYALYNKAMTEQNVSPTDRALAKNKLELDLTMARKFGMTHQDLRPYWTQEMIADEAKVNPKTPVPTPTQITETAPTATPAPVAETPKPPLKDFPVWANEMETLIKGAKKKSDLDPYLTGRGDYANDRSTTDKLAQLEQAANAKIADFDKAERNRIELNGQVQTIRNAIEDGSMGISESEIRSALGMNKRGGGSTSGKLTGKSIQRHGKTLPTTLDLVRDGNKVQILYKGMKVGEKTMKF